MNPHDGRETYRCLTCFDRRVVVTSADGKAPAAKPCPVCQPANNRRRREGHFEADHNAMACTECRGIRTGTVSASDYMADGHLPRGFLPGL